jgi:5-methylcytosine-specific restriction endonuclease McrA
LLRTKKLGEAVELHHIKPVKAGGKYKLDNIQPLHRICHQQVTHKDPNINNQIISVFFYLDKKNLDELGVEVTVQKVA